MFLIHFRPIFPKEVYKNIMAVKVRSADSKENVIYKRIKVKKKEKAKPLYSCSQLRDCVLTEL